MEKSYIVNKLENNSFEPIGELSSDEFIALEKCIESINIFTKQFFNYLYYQLNFVEFDKLIMALSDIAVTNLNASELNTNKKFININKVVFNLLSSYKFFLDSSETFLKRKFGKDSKETLQFIKMTNFYFDNSFAYRFLSKLRHYTQHIGFPIHHTPFEVTENLMEPQKMKGNFKLLVSRNILLLEKELLGAIVYKDIQARSYDIDIKPLIYELTTIIGKLEYLIYNFEKSELVSNIKIIDNNYSKFKTKTNKIVVMYDVTIGVKYHTFSTTTLPLDEISELNNFINWAAKNCH